MSEGEKFDCNECTARDKTVRGCDGSRKWKVGRHEVWGCPQKLVTTEALEKIGLWGRWKRYGWPYAGGWAEQPARVFDIVDAVEGEYVAIENARLEKARGQRN